MRRVRPTLAAAVVAVVMLAGCQSSAVQPDPNNPDQFEIITWWTAGSDRVALEGLVEVYSATNPDIHVFDASVQGADGAQARTSIAARLDAANPPDSFQAVAGAGLHDYVADGRLQNLTALYDEAGLSGAFRSELLDLVEVDGTPYAVPANIHRGNVVWANTATLHSAGVPTRTPPGDIDAWIDDLEAVRLAGVEFPLAVGDGSTQAQLFESVLIADLGAQRYAALWSDAYAWSADDVRSAIEDYGRLLEFADPAAGAHDWRRVADAVVTGEAGYAVLADYAVQPFEQAGLEYGADYTAAPTPGTDGVFALSADTFTLPVGAAHEDAARAWLRTLASVDGQLALNTPRGSTPTRSDVPTEDFSPYQRSAIVALQLDTIVPSFAYGVAADRAWASELTDAVVAFGHDGRSSAFRNRLVTAARSALGFGSG